MTDTSRAPAVMRKIAAWAPLLASFFWLQSATQLLAIAAGLLIVRSLAIEPFALYTVALAVQTTMIILADSGVTQSLLARGGAVATDRRRFTEVVKTAVRLRLRLELLTLVLGLPVLVALLRSYDVGWAASLIACGAVALALHGTVKQTLYSTVLFLQLRPRDAQIAGMTANAIRLALVGAALYLTREWLPFLWVGAVALYAQGSLTERRAAAHFDQVHHWSRVDEDAMLLAFRNQLLNGIYFALQPQITIWILTVFGTATEIAEVGALSRLAVAFTLISSAFSSLALPRFARYQEPRRIRLVYAGLVALTVAIGLGVFVLAWLVPGPLLAVLGSRYAHLERELAWIVGASSLSLVASAIHLLNASRGWIRGVWLGVPATVAAQAALVMMVDVSTVRGAILIQASAFAAPLLINLAIGLRGMRESERSGLPANA